MLDNKQKALLDRLGARLKRVMPELGKQISQSPHGTKLQKVLN